VTNDQLPTLVLWDIDHTLLTISGVSRKIYETAFRRITGQAMRELADMTGSTERAILLETLARHGLEGSDAFCERFFAALAIATQELRPEMIRHGHALPGAQAALRGLAADHVVQSVVTGNIKAIALIKLEAFGLADGIDFEVGGYGDDDGERAPLVRLAIERTTTKYGYRFTPDHIFVIGDTPFDMQAAHIVGVRGIGVATGSSTTTDLAEARADTVLPDLTDLAALRAAVTS
jgi:phosphoglycolate phosphatase-like HAD superfamily hydrolase